MCHLLKARRIKPFAFVNVIRDHRFLANSIQMDSRPISSDMARAPLTPRLEKS